MHSATALLCPHCHEPLEEVTAKARSGYLIMIDQCGRCGGIWCDRWELFPIRSEEATRLDPIDPDRLYAAVPTTSQPGRCPRCSKTLKPFRDPILPPDARIERCPACEGMWLNRGELRRFKQRAASTPRRQRADVERLARSLGITARWSTVSQLNPGEAPVDNIDDPEEARSELWSAGAWVVLRLLLKLLLRI